MIFAKAALARFATRDAAREAAEQLEDEGFVLRRIPASREQRVVTGATMGWCAMPAKRSGKRLPAMLENLVGKMHGSVTIGQLQSLDIPQDVLIAEPVSHAIISHIVVVSGMPEDVERGVRKLHASNGLLDLDLY